jgi:chemotaxis protein CheX
MTAMADKAPTPAAGKALQPVPAAAAAAAAAAMPDGRLVAPFINSVRALFARMLGGTVEIQRPYLKAGESATHDVSCVIGFTGEVGGSVVVSLERGTAEKLATAFTGLPLACGTSDFNDAVGEIANMVVGGAKQELGKRAKITVPTVIVGPNHYVARLSGVPCVVIPCKTPGGNFAVEINIQAH